MFMHEIDPALNDNFYNELLREFAGQNYTGDQTRTTELADKLAESRDPEERRELIIKFVDDCDRGDAVHETIAEGRLLKVFRTTGVTYREAFCPDTLQPISNPDSGTSNSFVQHRAPRRGCLEQE